jgi:hypothetical protein
MLFDDLIVPGNTGICDKIQPLNDNNTHKLLNKTAPSITINFYDDHVVINATAHDFLHAWTNEHQNVLFVDMKDVDGSTERGLQINLSTVKRAIQCANIEPRSATQLSIQY